MEEAFKALIATGGGIGLLAAFSILLNVGLLVFIRGLFAVNQALTTAGTNALAANTEVNRQTNDNRMLITDAVKELGHSMALNQAQTQSLLAELRDMGHRIEGRS